LPVDDVVGFDTPRLDCALNESWPRDAATTPDRPRIAVVARVVRRPAECAARTMLEGGREGHTTSMAGGEGDRPRDEADGEAAARKDGLPLRTRTGRAWVGACAAALVVVGLAVFVAQNTQRARVSFLWLDGDPPVAVVALVAAVAGAAVMLVVGTARIVQLRRAVRRQR
jgi:uncharacterized integral membrane protein